MDEQAEHVFVSGGGRTYGRTQHILDAIKADIIANEHYLVGDWGRRDHNYFHTCQNCHGTYMLEFQESGYYTAAGKLQACVCPAPRDEHERGTVR